METLIKAAAMEKLFGIEIPAAAIGFSVAPAFRRDIAV
jgi:hypothetical protein